jgi:hypothetical protein
MKSASDKSGLPAWFLIVAAGGLAGIVGGAFLFFGGSPKSSPSDSKTPTVAATPTKKTTTSPAKAGGGTPVLSGKQPVTYEDWTAQITSTNEESYPALMDGVLRVKDEALRSRVTEFLLVKWLNAGPESYLEYLDTLEGADDEGKQAWPVLVPAFVKAVPQVTGENASSGDLEEAVLWMTDYYAEQNPTAALDWAKQWLLGDAQESALASIAGQLSKGSLDQALSVASALKSPEARADAMANIGSELGKTDPKKALEWAQGLKDPTERSAAVEEVMWSMTDSDPAAAAAQVKLMNNPGLLENIGGSIAESLADKNPKEAVDWAEAIPAGAAQDEAVVGALSGWAKTDPKAALAYLQSKHSKNYDATEGVFEQWATSEPTAAAAEARKLADPAQQEQAVVGVVNGWLSSSGFDAAEQWVDQLPVGRQRDVASATLVDALSVEDPQPAWDRALVIKDAQVREEAILSAFSGLAQVDADAARSALSAPGLSDAERKLLKPVLDATAVTAQPPQN